MEFWKSLLIEHGSAEVVPCGDCSTFNTCTGLRCCNIYKFDESDERDLGIPKESSAEGSHFMSAVKVISMQLLIQSFECSIWQEEQQQAVPEETMRGFIT